jgi:hypothetical protein
VKQGYHSELLFAGISTCVAAAVKDPIEGSQVLNHGLTGSNRITVATRASVS